MRIISGKYGGRILKPPGKFRARPTTDLAKEGLFNILQNYFDFNALKVLDLFAGTGGIGLEFISRGAVHCDLVEKNHHHFSFIKKVIGELHITNAMVFKTDAFKFIPRIKDPYNIIFADPPYDMENLESLPVTILSGQFLAPGGWFILEHSGNYNFTNTPGCFQIRKYGSVNFSFFQNS